MSCCNSNIRKNKKYQYQKGSNFNYSQENNEINNSFNKNYSHEKFYEDNTPMGNNKEIGKFNESPRTLNYSDYGIVGLYNLGSCCYFNAAIQNLKNVYPFTLYILKNHKNFNKSDFAYSYCKLLANLLVQSEYQSFEPREFFDHFTKLSPNFKIGEQNDSNICIINILNKLEKETKREGLPNPDIIDSLDKIEKEKFKDFINKSYSKRNSYILDYFFGFQQDTYECRNKYCKYKNILFQGFTVLNIPIVSSKNISLDKLDDAIKYYQYKRLHKDEQGFDCPICKKYNIQTDTKIIAYPKILIINFKRIGEKYFYNHSVEIPPKLNLDKYRYELIGFIKHIGGAKYGHNIAICKNFFDNKWYVYDDSQVAEIKTFIKINIDYIPDTKHGFLYFYKKYDIFDNIDTEQEKNLIIKVSSEIKNS